MKLRQFFISATLFWGWEKTYDVDLDEFNTIEKVIDAMKNSLHAYFASQNLIELCDKVKQMQLHVHEDTQSIFYDSHKENHIVYLCDHCHSTDHCSD